MRYRDEDLPQRSIDDIIKEVNKDRERSQVIHDEIMELEYLKQPVILRSPIVQSHSYTSGTSGTSDTSGSSGTSGGVIIPGGSEVLQWPVWLGTSKVTYISSHYGMRSGKLHKGVDIAPKRINSFGDKSYIGPPAIVVAAGSGTVRATGYGSSEGYYIVIDHGRLIKNTITRTAYFHLVNSSEVKKGQSVTRGQRIALVGSTGNSTGPHLHFEVRLPDRDNTENPLNYISGR